jgi:glycerate kinase
MNILIAPNSFRGSLDAFQVADIIGNAFEEANPNFQIQKVPIADGGDFTGDILLKSKGGEWKKITVLNALGKPIKARLGITKDKVGIVELSEASGTRRIGKEGLNPLITTTYGTGQLIKAALDEGCEKIIVGLGGSATVDGGVGLLQALGVVFLDKDGEPIGFGGGELHKIESINRNGLDSRIRQTEIIVPCDVNNYLLGERGTVETFAEQKGATPEMMEILEEGMTQYALKVWEEFRKDIVNLKFAGAAGGTAGGMKAFLGAKLLQGSRFVLDELNFDEALKRADLVITAEGKLDFQTFGGKAPYEVSIRAKRFKKSIIAIAGQVPLREVEAFDAVFSIMNKPMTIGMAIENAEALLHTTALQIAKLYSKITQPKPKQKAIEKLLILNLDAFDVDEETLEAVAFTLLPLKRQQIPMLLYSRKTKSEILNICEQLAIFQPFVAENGGALYVPKGYLKLELDGFSENDKTMELPFGTTKDFIENITEKLAMISGMKSLKMTDITPLDVADILEIEIKEAERMMDRKYSQQILKAEQKTPINDTFKQLLNQQGLSILETEHDFSIGHFNIEKPVQYWIELLKNKYPEIETFAIGNDAIDAPIFKLVNQAFLLKKEKEWEQVHADNLNMINAGNAKGLKVCLSELKINN